MNHTHIISFGKLTGKRASVEEPHATRFPTIYPYLIEILSGKQSTYFLLRMERFFMALPFFMAFFMDRRRLYRGPGAAEDWIFSDAGKMQEKQTTYRGIRVGLDIAIVEVFVFSIGFTETVIAVVDLPD